MVPNPRISAGSTVGSTGPISASTRVCATAEQKERALRCKNPFVTIQLQLTSEVISTATNEPRAAAIQRRAGSIRLLAGRRRDALHRCNDAAFSFDGRPSRSPSIEMSSSRSGQWIPMPGPINCHRRRSLGRPSASRGYHLSGTDTLRPSRNSTTSASSVTLTCFAVAASVARLEVVMPCLDQLGLVLPHQR